MGLGFFHLGASAKEKRPVTGTGEIAKTRLKRLLNTQNAPKKMPGEQANFMETPEMTAFSGATGQKKRPEIKETLTQGKKHDKTIQIKRL